MNFSGLQQLTGGFKTLPTLSGMLDSLGKFKGAIAVRPLSEYRGSGLQPGHIPFTLSESGMRFFKELLCLKSVSPKAQVLTYKGTTSYGKGLLRKFNVLPVGIIFEAEAVPRYPGQQVKQLYFLDLTRFLFGEEEKNLPIPHLLARAQEELFRKGLDLAPQLTLTAEGTRWQNFPVAERLKKEFGFSGELELLSLRQEKPEDSQSSDEDELIFSHRDQYSTDFQVVMCKHPDIYKGKDVILTGCGTMADGLYALRLGAKTLRATDISLPYVLMANWNLQYAQDTGQISQVLPGQVEISLKEGILKGGADTVYLFNAPSIRDRREIADEVLGAPGSTFRTSNFIPEEDFIKLFEQLIERLSLPGVVALWRIFPLVSGKYKLHHFTAFDKGFVERTGYSERNKWSAYSLSRAIEFLKKHQLTADHDDSAKSIFLIKKG